MRVWHSPWSWLKEIDPLDSVAGNTLIRMFTRLIFRKPFQVARAATISLQSSVGSLSRQSNSAVSVDSLSHAREYIGWNPNVLERLVRLRLPTETGHLRLPTAHASSRSSRSPRSSPVPVK